MKPLPLIQARFVCRSCRETRRSFLRTSSFASASVVKDSRRWISTIVPLQGSRRSKRLQLSSSQTSISPPPEPSPPDQNTKTTDRRAEILPVTDFSDPALVLDRWIAKSKQICSASTLPDESDVFEHLETSRQLSEVLIYGEVDKSLSDAGDTKSLDTPTSSILGLEESVREGAKAPLRMSISFRQRAATLLAESLRDLLCHPQIFISRPMLQVYVRVQVLLGKPEHLPEVFHLYAHKPEPRASESSHPSSNPKITYHSPSPNHPKNAIPLPLATAALTSAIVVKSLPLALSIIETSVATPSFRRAKFLSRGFLPLAFLSLTPFCAYTISTYVGHHYQNTYDPHLATWLCLAGIMTYVGTTATMGFVALTTSNDQMQRVVWQPGTRLRDRWFREEERAAFDRVAMAWGFKERWRRGEERGEDWEALREFCARRGMVLDKTELLEGME